MSLRALTVKAAVLVLCVLWLGGCAGTEAVSPRSFAADVAWLADDAREGRETGSPGQRAAAHWLAQRFADMGLLPAGAEGSFFQPFTAAGARRLGEDNRLVLGELSLTFEEDWIPFSTSASGRAQGPLVFAGFGISDPAGGYDDYEGLDVRDAVVLVLRGAPGEGSAALRRAAGEEIAPGRWSETGPGRSHASFSSKINAAYRRGAVGVLVVNDPLSYPPGSEKDGLLPYAASGGDGVAASIPAGQLTAAAGARVLEAQGYDFEVLQQRIDQLMRGRSFRFPSAQADVTVDAERAQVETENVVAILPGASGRSDGEHVLIGAHYDHLGYGHGHGSRGDDSAIGQIHSGADDNASGTAGLVGVAQMLVARRANLARPVVFVAFSGEEWGLLGARHYVDHPALPLADLLAMVNMDMIGRSVGGKVDVGGAGSWEGFPELIEAAHAAAGGGLVPTISHGASGSSDHAPFLESGIPALFFFTGLHDDYHKPSDKSHLVEVVHGARIATLAGEVVAALSGLGERPVFRALTAQAPHGVDPHAADPHAGDPHAADPHAAAHAGDPHAAPAEGERPVVIGYGVRLGSIPDMAYGGSDGVRVAGVGADSPAAKAGLQAGDRITALDGTAIRSLEDYSVLLFSRRPGDTIVLTVVRGDETLELSALLESGARAQR